MSGYHPTKAASPEDRAAHGGLTCWEFDNFIVDYLEGVLPAASRALFEAHLATCELCQAYLDGYRGAQRAAQIACADEPPADAPPELIEAIIAAMKLA